MGRENGITLLIPKQGDEGQVFYQITPWDEQFPWHPGFDAEVKNEAGAAKEDKPISKTLKTLFLPRQGEHQKFKQMLTDQKPFAMSGEYQCRAFWPVVRDGKIRLILLSDDEINISGDVLYSRSARMRKTF